MKIEQIMTKNPSCCTPDDFVEVAAAIMNRYDTGIVPVTEGLERPSRLLGVLTDRDLCLGVLSSDRDSQVLRVEEFMSTNLATCLPSDTAEKALSVMAHARVRRLPVVNKKYELVGMVAMGDIVRHKAAREEDVYKTMAVIWTAKPAAGKKAA